MEGVHIHDFPGTRFVSFAFGYSMMICTVIEGNEPQIKGMAKYRRENIGQFRNKRTKNTCIIAIKPIY